MDGKDVEREALAALEEHELVRRAAGGDGQAFGVIYERYVQKIFNYVYYRTGNVMEAEDLTSHVFFRALGRIEAYDDRGLPISAWLYRIAHNLVANWHRDSSRYTEVELDENLVHHGEGDRPDMAVEATEETENLMRVIRRLPDDRQQVLILKFVEGLSNAEVGVIMGKSEGAVKSLYHRTLLALRQEMEEVEKDRERRGEK
jgi:RNA polymerase sigma-70 factor (ECF subfamily)